MEHEQYAKKAQGQNEQAQATKTTKEESQKDQKGVGFFRGIATNGGLSLNYYRGPVGTVHESLVEICSTYVLRRFHDIVLNRTLLE